ncbi:MAG: hypothetical protein HPY30_09165 [Gammaproteobacteria bacterium (ex Lamellibrachia satsuma)]|nr:MAG: hypothetical protein HPY30_09165 [Gammaproteobacteria bacterium (ex Lamellibrachia satsuma)]
MESQRKEINLFAVTLLILGFAYYLLVRNSVGIHVAVGPEYVSIISWFIENGWIPSFIHIYALSLFTWSALAFKSKYYAIMLWLLINAIFEVGQAIPTNFIEKIPDLFGISSYLANGTFDWLDIIAVCVGGVVALLTMYWFESVIKNKDIEK